MIDEAAIQMVRDALYIVLLIATPLLLVGMALGLVISLIQSVTSIQDQTLTFVPKIISLLVVVILLLPWILTVLGEFAVEMMQLF
ncbi:MAG: flagellar biosynthetic protein FliQ [Phycisphaerales bacterium]|nr:flagellar biosynthetic protein FliQ [Phycisphaerales bacterium]